MPQKNDSYDPLHWMIVKKSIEEELTLECTIREIVNSEDDVAIKELCTTLVHQNWYQAKLLGQAVGRIAEMDSTTASVLRD